MSFEKPTPDELRALRDGRVPMLTADGEPVPAKPVWIKIERRGRDAVLPGGWAVTCSDTQFCVTVTTLDEAIKYIMSVMYD